MSECIRRIIKPTEESYIKCDKCGKEITEAEAEMPRALHGFGPRLFSNCKIKQIIYDPYGHVPEQTITHDLCLDCYKEFLNWLEED